jgi:hypothetical protein
MSTAMTLTELPPISSAPAEDVAQRGTTIMVAIPGLRFSAEDEILEGGRSAYQGWATTLGSHQSDAAWISYRPRRIDAQDTTHDSLLVAALAQEA